MKPPFRLSISKGMTTLIDHEDYLRLAAAKLLKWNAQKVGKRYYASRNTKDQKLYLHRWVMNAPTGMVIDHIDGDSLNNMKANLRLCHHRDNARNQRNQENRQSVFKGVTKQRNSPSWISQIEFGGEHVRLGSFGTAEDAAKAYDLAAVLLFGDFALPNYAASMKFIRLRDRLIAEIGHL